jgi:hypothetical protein
MTASPPPLRRPAVIAALEDGHPRRQGAERAGESGDRDLADEHADDRHLAKVSIAMRLVGVVV